MLTLIRCPFYPHVTAVARKISRSSAKSAGGRLHLKHAYTLDPTMSEWADYAAVQAQCWILSGNALTRNLSGKVRPQSSQLAEPLWTDSGIKSGIGVRELISTVKKKSLVRAH